MGIIFKVFKDGDWMPRNIEDLKHGNIISIYENEEKYVNKETNEDVWVVTSMPYINQKGIMETTVSNRNSCELSNWAYSFEPIKIKCLKITAEEIKDE